MRFRSFRPLAAATFALTIVLLAACAPVTVSAPIPAVNQPGAVQSGTLQPVGYRPEFGTMWTFDSPPLDYWRATYNFTPDQRWLDHVRLAAVRLPNCSASFVSSNGLVLSNHHCARSCTDAVSPKDTNYMETGYMARNASEEKKCPGLYVDQLESTENVTTRVRSAITASTPEAQAAQRTAVIGTIQSECRQQTQLNCQVVTLYQGGIYSLYRYRRFDDIRIVWVPEEGIASFGGDPDNFTFPRYDLDASLFRVYVNGQPFHPADYLKWSAKGASDGELIFVVGNPGSTGRLNTLSQMEFLRDYGYPARLAGYRRALSVFREMEKTDPAAARRFQNEVFGLENSFKAITGYRAGLLDSASMATKRAFERDFRARLAADPALRAKYGGVYDAITGAQAELGSFDVIRRNYGFGPGLAAAGSRLLTMAGQLVRLSNESALPDSLRLTEFRGPRLNSVRSSLEGDVAIDPVYERLALAALLRSARAELPAGDAFLTAALAGRTPEQAADAFMRDSRVKDADFRRSLIAGGASAVAASADPLIVLARYIDPLNRANLKREAGLNAIVASNSEKLGQALFEIYGTALPPDATFTLRISDGLVKGYPMNGTVAPYKVTLYGLYGRWSDFDHKSPFNLPAPWVEKMSRLDLSTPVNFVSTNDIIGGNSGSPLVNRNAELVGLAFDSNIEGVGNRFLVNTESQRTVSVHSRFITEALRKVYDGGRIADELEGR